LIQLLPAEDLKGILSNRFKDFRAIAKRLIPPDLG
jgi:hypothetical protein